MRLDSGIDVDDFSTTNIFSTTNFKFYYHFYYQFRVVVEVAVDMEINSTTTGSRISVTCLLPLVVE